MRPLAKSLNKQNLAVNRSCAALKSRLRPIDTLIRTLLPGRQSWMRAWLLAWLLIALPAATLAGETKPLAQDSGTAASTPGTFSGAMDTVYPDWFKTSFLELEEDVAEAAEQGKRLMVIFHQDGCPYCNALIEHNLAQKDIEETLKTKFDVIEINMWGDREVASVDGKLYTEKTFAEALKVQFTPTVLFLTETGSLALRINGYYDPDRFRLVLDYVAGKHEANMTFAEYSAQFTTAKPSSTLTAQPYFTAHGKDAPVPQGKHTKPYILFFEQNSCRNCQDLHGSVLVEAGTRELLDQFDVYQIDMWGNKPLYRAKTNLADKNPADAELANGRTLAKHLGVSYAPTLILYSSDGEEVIRSEAWFKKFHTQSILEYVLSDGWRAEANFQRYISARADELREQGVDVNLWD